MVEPAQAAELRLDDAERVYLGVLRAEVGFGAFFEGVGESGNAATIGRATVGQHDSGAGHADNKVVPPVVTAVEIQSYQGCARAKKEEPGFIGNAFTGQ